MSFGWSAGDIAAAISLLVKVGTALKESGGAASEYQDAVTFLESIGKTLAGVEKLLSKNEDLEWEAEMNAQIVQVKQAVADFETKIKKYDLSLGADSSRSKARQIPRKVQFALTSHVEELRNGILQSQLILDGFVNLQTLGYVVENARKSQLSFTKVEAETNNLSKLITDSVEVMKGELSAQTRELKNAREGTEAVIRNDLGIVKAHLEQLQALNISLSDQRRAEWQEDFRTAVRALYACNKTFLDLIMQKGITTEDTRKVEMRSNALQAALVSFVQIVGAGLAGGLGASIAISSHLPKRGSTSIISPSVGAAANTTSYYNTAISFTGENIDSKSSPEQGSKSIQKSSEQPVPRENQSKPALTDTSKSTHTRKDHSSNWISSYNSSGYKTKEVDRGHLSKLSEPTDDSAQSDGESYSGGNSGSYTYSSSSSS